MLLKLHSAEANSEMLIMSWEMCFIKRETYGTSFYLRQDSPRFNSMLQQRVKETPEQIIAMMRGE